MDQSQAAFLMTVVFSGLLAANIWYFFVRPARPWFTRVGVVLQIIGIYTFVFGVASKMDLLPKDLIEDMTSPDLFVFLRANFKALAILFMALSMGTDPETTAGSATNILQLLLALAYAPLALAITTFHLLVVVPLSYIAYVVASVPVTAIENAATEIGIRSGGTEMSIKVLVASNAVAVKNLAIAFPALMLRVALDIAAVHRKPPQAVAIPRPKRAGWMSRHQRAARLLLRVCQGLMAVTGFTAAIVTALLPWLTPSSQAGQIVGVAIVTTLIVWALVALIVKAERIRKELRGASPTAVPIRHRVRRLAMAAAAGAALVWLYAAIDTSLRSLTRCESDDAQACTSACEANVAWACIRLGGMFEHGTNGVEKDAARAVELYQPACDDGSAESCHRLARMYAEGAEGLAANPMRARPLYEQACDGGEWAACTRLGALYAAGQDCACAEVEAAMAAFQKACDHDEVEGCAELLLLSSKRKGRILGDSAKTAPR